MLLFRSEEHVDKWCRDWKMERGAVLNLRQCSDLAQAWYGPDRRKPDWRRRTVDEAHELFASLGLSSPFWNLRG